MTRWGLFRIPYLAWTWVPLLAAMIDTGTALATVLDAVAGWTLLGIGQNLLNDLYDDDRDTLDRDGLVLLAAAATVLGLALLRPYLVYAVPAVVLMTLYSARLKGVRWLQSALLAGAGIVLPFISLGGNHVLAAYLAFTGIVIDLVHRVAEDEHTGYGSGAMTAVRVLGVAGVAATAAILWLQPVHRYLWPAGVFFAGVPVLMDRLGGDAKPTTIYGGVLFVVYLLGVVAARGLLA